MGGALLLVATTLLQGQPLPDSGRGILVGIEYVLIDNPARTTAYARELSPVGFTTIKHYAEHAEWGAMQSGPRAPIDFRRLDAYVREFQASGVREIVVCLRSASGWGSKHAPKLRPTNLAPKPEYLNLYARWIGAVVERYDGDGRDDMPGLRFPVRYYEIGSEFSSYEPEPVDEYLAMLERAYRAAHDAFDGVRVAHAAFLTTAADFRGHPGPAGFERAFAAIPPRIAEHSLADIRKILDRPDLFDVLNLHSLGDPSEIEDLSGWLDWEMGRRGYRKRIIISDTAMTPWIAWGNATVCDRPAAAMGVIVWPAVATDRCRLAGYFRKLVDGDPVTVRQQLLRHLNGYDRIRRVSTPDTQVRVYQIERGATRRWIAWLEPDRVLLPGDPIPTREVAVEAGTPRASLESLITEPGVTAAALRTLTSNGGRVTISVTPTPVVLLAIP